MSSRPQCAVCPETAALRGIIVAGAELFLCSIHEQKLGARTPESFEQLAQLLATRRASPDRRRGERRAFPRPEGRRLNDGRRAEDA